MKKQLLILTILFCLATSLLSQVVDPEPLDYPVQINGYLTVTDSVDSPFAKLDSVHVKVAGVWTNILDLVGGSPWNTNANGIDYIAGNVGIGKSLPTETLQVDGDILFTNDRLKIGIGIDGDDVDVADGLRISLDAPNNLFRLKTFITTGLHGDTTIIGGDYGYNPSEVDELVNIVQNNNAKGLKLYGINGYRDKYLKINLNNSVGVDIATIGVSEDINFTSSGVVQFQWDESGSVLRLRDGKYLGYGAGDDIRQYWDNSEEALKWVDPDDNEFLNLSDEGVYGAFNLDGSLQINQGVDNDGIKLFGVTDPTFAGEIFIDANGWLNLKTDDNYIQYDGESGHIFKTNGTSRIAIAPTGAKVYNDYIIGFGSSMDFKIKFNSTTDKLEFQDADANLFSEISDEGTLGNFQFNGNISINSSGTNNTFIDIDNYSSTGSRQIIIGEGAGESNTDDNVVIGYGALTGHYGTYATVVGSQAGGGLNAPIGLNTSLFGYQAGFYQDGGAENTFIGMQSGHGDALLSLNNDGNTGIGFQSLYILGAGDKNIGLGAYSGYLVNEADNTVSLGWKVSASNTNYAFGLFRNATDENTNGGMLHGISAGDDVYLINEGTYIGTTGTIADNDPTPDVRNGNTFIYGGSANSVTITDLDNPHVGAYYTIIGNSDTYTVTINDSGFFNLEANAVLGADDLITIYVVADDNYIQAGKLINN